MDNPEKLATQVTQDKEKTKGKQTAIYKHLQNRIGQCFFYILFLHLMLYFKAHSV
jgi:hypothetical protein